MPLEYNKVAVVTFSHNARLSLDLRGLPIYPTYSYVMLYYHFSRGLFSYCVLSFIFLFGEFQLWLQKH